MWLLLDSLSPIIYPPPLLKFRPFVVMENEMFLASSIVCDRTQYNCSVDAAMNGCCGSDKLSFGPLCENMTSSTKPEVTYRNSTRGGPSRGHSNIHRKSGAARLNVWFLRYGNRQTYRQAYRNTLPSRLVNVGNRRLFSKVRKRIAVCAISTAPLRELTCRMGSHNVACQPAEVTFPPLLQPIKAGTAN